MHRLDVAAEFGNRLAGFLGEGLDVLAQQLDLLALLGDEIMPADAAEAADRGFDTLMSEVVLALRLEPDCISWQPENIVEWQIEASLLAKLASARRR